MWRNSPDAPQQNITLLKAFGGLDQGIGTLVERARRTPEPVPLQAAKERKCRWRCLQYDGIVAAAVEHGLSVQG